MSSSTSDQQANRNAYVSPSELQMRSYSETQQPSKPNAARNEAAPARAPQYYRGSLDSSSQQYKPYVEPRGSSYLDESCSRNSPAYTPRNPDPVPAPPPAYKGSPSRSLSSSYHHPDNREFAVRNSANYSSARSAATNERNYH